MPPKPYSLEDFMSQIGDVRNLGPLDQFNRRVGRTSGDVEQQLSRKQAVYNSMTGTERKNTGLLDGSRRRRISRGAGVEAAVVGHFVAQFETTRAMLRAIGGASRVGL